jgi:hypothetical protein
MPRGDRTGPMGYGPRTGRAAGYCAGYAMPGYMNPVGGRLGMGFAWGHGRGYAWRRSFVPYGVMPYHAYPDESRFYGQTATPEGETEMLQHEAKVLREQLDFINKRIDELEKAKGKKNDAR